MRGLSFAAALIAGLSVSVTDKAQAESTRGLVCFVSYANPYQAVKDDPLSIARASVMPRQTALTLVTQFSIIYDYPNMETLVQACQCLHNPAPANSLRERDEVRARCPKPTRIEGPKP